MSEAAGAVIRVRRVEGAPVVAVRVWCRGGSRAESIPGQALVAGRMLCEGTASRTWDSIAADAEDRGAVVASSGGPEFQGLGIDALAADWEPALAWAAELALESSFPAGRCDWVRRQAAAELASLADHPDVVAGQAFLDQLYRPHPRSRPLQGDAASLERLTAEDCARFHRQALAAGVIVTVTGRVEEEAVRRRAEDLFAPLRASPASAAPPPLPRGRDERRIEVATPGSEQAHVFAGHLTVARAHPALPEILILGIILGAGAGLTGRIPYRVREREGLAYAASAEIAAGAGIDPGHLVAYAGTAPDQAEAAARAMAEEIERAAVEGVTEDEVSEARSYLLGREPFRRETARQWAGVLAAAELYGLPLDDPAWARQRLEEVDLDRVTAAARRHLRPGDLRITVGLPAGTGCSG